MPTDLELEPSDVDLEDHRTEEDDEEVQSLRYAISATGPTTQFDGLVKRIREGAIFIPEVSARIRMGHQGRFAFRGIPAPRPAGAEYFSL